LEANLSTCNQISKAADKKVAVIDKKGKELLDLRNSLLKIITDCKKGCCSPNLEDTVHYSSLNNQPVARIGER
jgi:hypothetical protein